MIGGGVDLANVQRDEGQKINEYTAVAFDRW